VWCLSVGFTGEHISMSIRKNVDDAAERCPLLGV